MKFAGWIAIFKGKQIEIRKDEAKDLWAAKQLAIARFKLSKNQSYLMAIEPAYD